MKRERTKGFISGIIISVLVFSLIGTAAATIGSRALTADYNDIKVEVNGTQIALTDAAGNPVEPFSVNGTTYLPVRAVGDALNLDVNWNSERKTVELNENTSDELLCVIPLMAFYKTLQEKLDGLTAEFNTGLGTELGIRTAATTQLKNGPYTGKLICVAAQDKINAEINDVTRFYNYCEPLGIVTESGRNLYNTYIRLANLAVSQYSMIEAGVSDEQIRTITGAATQNWGDCLSASDGVSAQFWAVYQDAKLGIQP